MSASWRLGMATTGLPPSNRAPRRPAGWMGGDLRRLLEAVRGARDHVHLGVPSTIRPDRHRLCAMPLVEQRARAGWKVRLLLDAVGSSRPRSASSPAVGAGGELAWFHPIRFGRVGTFRG